MLVFVSCDSNDDDGDDPGVNQSPDAEFTFDRQDLSVDFDASPSEDPDGEITSYSWEFGDGDTDTGETVSHTYEMEGQFDVTLTVEDTAGATDDQTQTIEVEMGTTGGGGGGGLNYANYDTTSTLDGQDVIRFSERGRNNDFGVVPEEDSGNVNVRENYVKWTAGDRPYLIDGRTFVNPGDTLEIEPGTVIKGVPNRDPTNASALIVANGGTILANGTEQDPIIFTTQEDNTQGGGTSISSSVDGAFGGVIILGNGPKNFPGSRSVEGIPDDIDRAFFGSNNPDEDHDAGVFKYVQIRYGGVSIGAGNEINGLTMGALGSGTEIHHVEVFNNRDDGFEWFGGNVNAHHLVASRVGDDSYDIDQGYSGDLQFLLAMQTPNRGDRTGEHDSGDDGFGGPDEGDTPVSDPKIYNATYFGSGEARNDDGDPIGGGDVALKLRDNFAGDYYNSVFYGFPKQMIEVEDASGPDSRQRWLDDELTVNESVAFKFAPVEDLGSGASTQDQFEALVEGWDKTQVANDLQSYGVTYADPGFSRTFPDMGLQTVGPVPPSGNSAVTGGQQPPSRFATMDGFEQVTYKGAFEPGGENWAKGWTLSDELGMFE
jgi:hypothetical protein